MTQESKYVTVFFDADSDALAWEVPEPLEFAVDGDGPMASVSIGDAVTPPKNMSPYHEGIVRIRVRFDGETGWYIPYIWVSNEESLLNGRVNGWPKLLCENEPLRVDGNEVHGEVTRRGQPLLSVLFRPRTAPDEGPDAAAEMGSLRGDVPGLQVKKVQSPAADGKVLRQVVRSTAGPVDLEDVYAGDVTLRLYDHPGFTLGDVTPTRIHGAFLYRPGLELTTEDASVVWESFE